MSHDFLFVAVQLLQSQFWFTKEDIFVWPRIKDLIPNYGNPQYDFMESHTHKYTHRNYDFFFFG